MVFPDSALGLVVWVLVAAFFLYSGWTLLRGAVLNLDQAQKEISDAIVLAARSDFNSPNVQELASIIYTTMTKHSVVSSGARRNRLVHALSMCRTRLTPQQFERARQVVKAFHQVT